MVTEWGRNNGTAFDVAVSTREMMQYGWLGALCHTSQLPRAGRRTGTLA